MAGLAGDVREDLLRAMRRGDYADGRLPPEADLARTLGISRATVRQALQSLAEDGVITRRRRHGTVINPKVLHGGVPLNRLVSFRDLVEQSGMTASVDPLVHQLRVPSAAARAALDLGADEEALVVERLVRADGAPAIVVVDVLPTRWLTVAADAVVDAESTFAFIAANTDAVVDHSLVELVPHCASAGEPAHLGLADGTPYVELQETLFGPEQEAVAFSRIAVAPGTVRLRLSRREA